MPTLSFLMINKLVIPFNNRTIGGQNLDHHIEMTGGGGGGGGGGAPGARAPPSVHLIIYSCYVIVP